VRKVLGDHLGRKEDQWITAAFDALKANRARRQEKAQKEGLALGQLGEAIQRKVFEILIRHAEERRRLSVLQRHLEEKTNDLLMRRCVRDMVSTYVVQPKLDAVADVYYKKKNLQKFKRNLDLIRERSQGGGLHEFEVKAFQLLGQNLLRKSFTALRVAQ